MYKHLYIVLSSLHIYSYINTTHVFQPVPELAEPSECLGVVHLLLDEFGHHIASMDINCTHSHNLLSVTGTEVTQEVIDELIQL